MYRAIVFNVAGLQEFEDFKSDRGYVEADHEIPQEAALAALRQAIGDVRDGGLDMFLVFDVIFAYGQPCGCVYENTGDNEPITLRQSKRIDLPGINAG